MSDQLQLFSHVGLWILMSLLYAAVFLLYRYVGREGLNSPRLPERQGPELNVPAGELREQTLSGDSIEFGASSDRSSVILFVAKGCSTCERLKPRIRAVASDCVLHTRTIVVVGGGESEASGYAGELYDDVAVISDREFELTRRWRIGVFPFAVLLDKAGIVRRSGFVASDNDLNEFYRIDELPADSRAVGMNGVPDIGQSMS